jgi:hypothetical protein
MIFQQDKSTEGQKLYIHFKLSIKSYSKMSETVPNTESRVRAPQRNRRSRASGGRGRGRGRNVERDEQPREERQPREIIPSPELPEELFGKTLTGKISDIVKRGRGQFGFIFVGEGARNEIPRVYFSFNNYTETSFPPRKGYMVEFECGKDDSGRSFAQEVRLTEEGLKEAEMRVAADQSRQENKKENPTIDRKERRRKDEEGGRNVVLKVTCEGYEETKQVTANVAQSIGTICCTEINYAN